MTMNKQTSRLRPEVGIKTDTRWNPQEFKIPRIFAPDWGGILRQTLIFGAISLVLLLILMSLR